MNDIIVLLLFVHATDVCLIAFAMYYFKQLALARQQTADTVATTIVTKQTPPVQIQPSVKQTPAQPPHPVIDDGLINFVKHEEGFKSHAYPDYKQYSIGYGTKANSPDEVIDEAEGQRRLIAELNVAANSVVKFAPKAPIGVQQALTDLTFNAGPGWQKAGLGQLITAGQYDAAKERILQYDHAGGEVNEGLLNRRRAEAAMFDKPL